MPLPVTPPPIPPVRMRRLPREPLKDFIGDLTITDSAPTGWPVVWEVDPLPFLGLVNDTLGAYIELSIPTDRSIGIDDYRQAFDEETETYTSVYYGLRAFTLTLDCRSYAPHIPAIDILESVRLRLINPRSVTAKNFFAAQGLSLIRVHPGINLSVGGKGDADNRMIWRRAMDVEFNWLSTAVATDDPGYIFRTAGDVPPDSPLGTNRIEGTILGKRG